MDKNEAMRACDNALDALLLLADGDKAAIEFTACGVEALGLTEHTRRLLEVVGKMHQARLDAVCAAGREIYALIVEFNPDKASAERMQRGAQGIVNTAKDAFAEARAEHRAEHMKGMH